MTDWFTHNCSEEREYQENCLCVTVLCTIIMVHTKVWPVLTGRSIVLGFDLTWFNSVFWEPLCLRSSCCYMCIKYVFAYIFLFTFSEQSLVGWVSMWLTNHRPSVLCHCWLGHLTHKIVPKMTYNVSSGTLDRTIPYTNNCLCTKKSPINLTAWVTKKLSELMIWTERCLLQECACEPAVVRLLLLM